MSNIKETIRQEIKRRKEELERDKYINIDAKACRHSELKFLERFIDSLPEEKPSEDLEEAVFKEWGTTKEEYLAKSMDKVHLEMEIATYLQDWEDDDEIGLHLSTDEGCMPIELEDVRDLARHFAEWQRKQMMKEAVEGGIGYWNQRGLSIRLDKSLEKLGYDEDTKVKVIIVKEEK